MFRYTRTIFIAVSLCILPFNTTLAEGSVTNKTKPADQQAVIKTGSGSIFSGLLYDVWNRLQEFSPQVEDNGPDQKAVATIGVRGASIPASPEQQKAVAHFKRAEKLIAKGDLELAIVRMERFLRKFPDSVLKPNAMFALGLSQAGLDDADASKRTLKTFIKDFPEHELVPDARKVIKQMKIESEKQPEKQSEKQKKKKKKNKAKTDT